MATRKTISKKSTKVRAVKRARPTKKNTEETAQVVVETTPTATPSILNEVVITETEPSVYTATTVQPSPSPEPSKTEECNNDDNCSCNNSCNEELKAENASYQNTTNLSKSNDNIFVYVLIAIGILGFGLLMAFQ